MEHKVTYKVLDVREYDSIDEASWRKGFGDSGYVRFDKKHIVAVIAEDSKGNRERFEFYKGTEFNALGDSHYIGYSGLYGMLVPGDTFTLTDTDTYTKVTITNVKWEE